MIPTEWNIAMMQLIWKNKGSKESIDMYRPIALTSISRKVIEWIILREIKISLKELDCAGRIQRRRSTYDLALALDTIIKDHARKKKQVWQAFLDIKGAYDSVDRELLWKKCSRMGLRGNTLGLLKGLFDGAAFKIRVRGCQSRAVKTGLGLL